MKCRALGKISSEFDTQNKRLNLFLCLVILQRVCREIFHLQCHDSFFLLFNPVTSMLWARNRLLRACACLSPLEYTLDHFMQRGVPFLVFLPLLSHGLPKCKFINEA